MIRYLGERRQLDEQPGIIQTVTEASSAAGERHEHLMGRVMGAEIGAIPTDWARTHFS